MNLSDVGIVVGITVSLLTPSAAGLKYYADHEYITVSSQIKRDIRELKAEIRDLEYDRKHGKATEKDLWLLDQLYNDLEALEQELD